MLGEVEKMSKNNRKRVNNTTAKKGEKYRLWATYVFYGDFGSCSFIVHKLCTSAFEKGSYSYCCRENC